jgi:nucleoside-diphosphate-sugar epimerase
MRYIVTGGAGFIGSHLCTALVYRGDQVTCVDNFSTGVRENVKHLANLSNFLMVPTEVLSFYDNAMDGIFHLASPTAPGDIQKFYGSTLTSNGEGTFNLIRMAQKAKAKMVFVSSVKIHGNCPRVEPYIVGKKYGELLCHAFGQKVARLASIYGPRMRTDDSRVIPVFIQKALKNEPLSLWNGGNQVDSFCFVDDLVRGLIAYMDSNANGVVEFGYPEGIKIKDLAKMIIELTGSKSEIVTTENVMVVDECHKVAELQRAKSLFGWTPKVPLEDGLQKTIDYYKEQF